MFAGKNALVLGVANKRSIAWAIAQRLAAGGARLAFTFQGERIEKNVRDLAESVSSAIAHSVAGPDAASKRPDEMRRRNRVSGSSLAMPITES